MTLVLVFKANYLTGIPTDGAFKYNTGFYIAFAMYAVYITYELN